MMSSTAASSSTHHPPPRPLLHLSYYPSVSFSFSFSSSCCCPCPPLQIRAQRGRGRGHPPPPAALPDPQAAPALLVAAGTLGVAATFLLRRSSPASQKQQQENGQDDDDLQLQLQAAGEGEEECPDCGGTGLCGRCKGEGFVFKQLSDETATKARKAAKNMATRYTAGLPTKWTYCNKCSSTRSCTTCRGSGKIIISTPS